MTEPTNRSRSTPMLRRVGIFAQFSHSGHFLEHAKLVGNVVQPCLSSVRPRSKRLCEYDARSLFLRFLRELLRCMSAQQANFVVRLSRARRLIKLSTSNRRSCADSSRWENVLTRKSTESRCIVDTSRHRNTSRLSVDGDRPSATAIERSDRPATKAARNLLALCKGQRQPGSSP